MEFKVGETVKLKSGGPVMTTIEIGDNGWITCTWFDGDKRTQTQSFPPQSLEVFKKGSAGLVGTW